MLVSVYSAFEISSLQAEVSTLQNQVLSDQQNLQSLQDSLYFIESRLSSTTATTTAPPRAIGINVVCLSVTDRNSVDADSFLDGRVYRGYSVYSLNGVGQVLGLSLLSVINQNKL